MFEKSLYAYASLILILLLGTSYGDVNNILVNPGFETGDTTGWSSHYGATISAVTSPVYSGSYSGRASGRAQTYQGIQQDIKDKVVIGQTYQISGRVRTSTSASSTVKISIQKTDNGVTSYATVATGTASSSGWVLLSGNYTVPEVNVIRTELYVYFEGPTTRIDIYVDDANVFGQVPGPTNPNATGQVNFNVTHQTLEGFGAAGAWYQNNVIACSSSHPEIYNILFRDLGIDIYRIRNTYGIDSSYISDTANIVQAANNALGHPIRVMNSSWSPQASLKSNGNTSQGTLAKDASGNYRYADFAQWWANSLVAWSAAGVNTYYINMQNEPDYSTSGWDTCLFDPTEDSTNAGYEQAFKALYNNLNTLPSRPKLLVAEGANINATEVRVNALDANDKSNTYGYSHHLYEGSANAPDGYITEMATLQTNYGDRPLMQTEFSASGPFTWTDAMNLAILMHNTLTVEGASAYLYWELFWPSPSGLVSISTTGYTINPVYYAMKHYSFFTDPNWQRVDANSTSSNLRISAYKDPCEPNAAIVVINTSTTTDVNLTLSLNGFNPGNSGIYQSKSDANFAYIGTFSTSTPVLLPKQSITTIHLAGFADCAAVQAGHYRLDSDLNGDCYVDYEDLAIIAYYWLHTDCTAPSNCQGADFAPTDGTVNFLDFADFGPQWMQCNNPLDANCTPNWE
ncbi:MAG: carbohydrate binding domain-containing protein [Sedimentisphaerales bacterium]|jgi:glucuronoarabinoxylan endo-1,4-beta-xylanase